MCQSVDYLNPGSSLSHCSHSFSFFHSFSLFSFILSPSFITLFFVPLPSHSEVQSSTYLLFGPKKEHMPSLSFPFWERFFSLSEKRTFFEESFFFLFSSKFFSHSQKIIASRQKWHEVKEKKIWREKRDWLTDTTFHSKYLLSFSLFLFLRISSLSSSKFSLPHFLP